MKLAFIGLGAMGLPMAKQLIAAGHEVTGFDVNDRQLEHFTTAGGKAAKTALEAARDQSLLILMVVNAEQISDLLVTQSLADVLNKDAIVISCSTVSAKFAQAFEAQLETQGLHFIDAPVSGGVVGAQSGSLSIMASGKMAHFEAVKPVLETMGKNLYFLGEQCGKGSAMKGVNQLLAGVQLATAAEAMGFAAQNGLDLEQVYDIICTSAGMSWMFKDRVPRMLEPEPVVASAVDIWPKDLGIVLETAKATSYPTPIAALVHQLFQMTSNSGWGKEDDSSIVKLYEKLSTSKVKKSGF